MDAATKEHTDRAHELATDIAGMPLSMQDRLGITVVAAGQLVGGAAAILNRIAMAKGMPAFPLDEACDAVMKLIIKELRSEH